MTRPDCAVMCNLINTHTHTHTHTHDQCEWHRMTTMTRPDCAVMCNLIDTHTHTDAVRKTGERRVESETNVEKKGLVEYLPTRII